MCTHLFHVQKSSAKLKHTSDKIIGWRLDDLLLSLKDCTFDVDFKSISETS